MEQPEHRLQIACATHLKHILSPNIFWTARDLATSRASEGEKKKAMGCKPGLSDIEIWMVGPRRRLHLELKVAKSRVSALGKLSDTQRAMIPIIEAYGEAFDVVWSVASLEEALTRHGVPWRQQAMFPTAEQRDISLATTPARKWRSFKRPSAAKIRKARAIRQHTMF
jgi:hypothetical protein